MRGETLPDDLPRVGDYRLIRRLGAGGMGQVWLAEHVETGRRFALKTLHPDAPLDIRERFEREVAAHARVDKHPNVVRIHHLGTDGGRPWMILDLMSGGSLEDRLREGPLPPEDLDRLARELASGLAHLHSHGVLHRDLKPANVLFDDEGRARIADFGLARLGAESGLTVTGEVLGSPSWMAPEQVDGDHRRHSKATDIYGLGAVLYHAATGLPPFLGGSVISTMAMVLNDAPRPPSELEDGISPVLNAAILRCLEKAPSRRFASAGELLVTLEKDEVPRSGRALWIVAALGLLMLLVVGTELVRPGTFPVMRARLRLPRELFVDGRRVRIEGEAGVALGSARVRSLNGSAEVGADGRFRLEVQPRPRAQRVQVTVTGLFTKTRGTIALIRDREPPTLTLRVPGRPEPLLGESLTVLDTRTTLALRADDRSAGLTLAVGDDEPVELRPGEARMLALDLGESFEQTLDLRVADRSGNVARRRVTVRRPQTLLEAFPSDGRREPPRLDDPLPPGVRESWLISKTVRIPRGLRVLVPSGVRLRFQRARIRCLGRLELAGSEDAPILLEPLGEGDFGGVVVHGPDARLTARHATFREGGPILVPGLSLDEDSDGGAIYAHGGASVVLEDCAFEACRVANRGGAITILEPGTSLLARRCRFTVNSASESGGAVAIGHGGRGLIEESRFLRNRAKVGAGLLVLGHGGPRKEELVLTRVELRSCHFEGNRARTEGGAIQLYRRSRLKVTGTRFEANVSGCLGGAIAIFNDGEDKEGESAAARFDSEDGMELYAAELIDCGFHKNEAGPSPNAEPKDRFGFGGAICAIGPGRIDLTDCRLGGNRAGAYAGAIGISGLHFPRIEGPRELRLAESRVFPWQVGPAQQLLLEQRLGQLPDLGDALYFNESLPPQGRLHLTDCELADNTAGLSGGALLAALLTRVELNNCTLTNNRARLEGGAVAATGEAVLGRRGRDWTSTVLLPLPLRHDGARYTTLRVRGGRFRDNTAVTEGSRVLSRGGAIALGGGVRLGVFRAEFTGNRASTLGGAIGSHVGHGLIAIVGCRFADNESGWAGGAVGLAPKRIGPLEVFLRDSGFTGNRATWAGGAVGMLRGVHLRMTDCRLTGNRAKTAGGLLLSRGVKIDKPAKNDTLLAPTLEMSGCTITGNTVTKSSPSGADVTLSEVAPPPNLREINRIEHCDSYAIIGWRRRR